MKWIIGIVGLALISLFIGDNSFDQVINNGKDTNFMVYISGEVVNSGWYDYQENISVSKLIEMAGGLTSNADTCTINIETDLLHKDRVYIASKNNGKINLNIATSQQLMSIKGIGEKTAQNMIDLRNQIGVFNNIYQLLEVKGIGEKTLVKLMDYLCVV